MNNRINQNTRQAVRRGTQYPAVVVDVHGTRASARLSGNGAIVHNLQVIGGPVLIGDQVSVDYTTPEPTIISVAKEWLTLDDVLRLLKKIQIPDIEAGITEMDKIVALCIDDPSTFEYFAASWSGLEDALNFAFNTDDAIGQAVRRWAFRIPPAGPRMPDTWTLRNPDNTWMPARFYGDGNWSTYFHYFGEGWWYCYGTVFENLNFTIAPLDEALPNDDITGTGSYPGVQMVCTGDSTFDQTGDLGQSAYFKNCRFRTYGPYLGSANEYDQYCILGILDDPYNRSADDVLIFEDCNFYVDQASCDNPLLIRAYHSSYSGDLPSADGFKTKVYLINCTVDCGPNPIGSNHPAWFEVYSYNTRWIGVADITALPNLSILNDGDRAAKGSIALDFLGLQDTPSSYAGQAGKIARVTLAEDGLEFATSGSGGGGADYFTDLLDTPSVYTGKANQFVTVKTAEDGLEFTDPPGRIFNFFVPGDLAVGDIDVDIPAPEAGEIDTVAARVRTGFAPSGADLIIDVKKNGTSIYPSASKPTIPDGSLQDLDSPPDTTSFAKDDIFSISIVQVGSTTPGSHLTVQVRCL